jgi:hypothetical protein
MEKLKELFKLIEDRIPFSLIRLNDGEAQGLDKIGVTIARGDQIVNESLHLKLLEAATHQQENYWIGVPCNMCIPNHYKTVMCCVPSNYKYLTKAVVTTNRNIGLMWNRFPELVKNLGIVCGDDQNLSKLSITNSSANHPVLDFSYVLRVPSQNAWEYYEKNQYEFDKFAEKLPINSITLLSCGPLSRVLAYEWFKKYPDKTFIDVGSCFDPFTRNVWHSCHKGTLKPCKGCN